MGQIQITEPAGLCARIHTPCFNIKMSSYEYRKSHCGDKTISRPSYLNNRISYSGKTPSLYWIRALVTDGRVASLCMIQRRGDVNLTQKWCFLLSNIYMIYSFQTYIFENHDELQIIILSTDLHLFMCKSARMLSEFKRYYATVSRPFSTRYKQHHDILTMAIHVRLGSRGKHFTSL